MVDKIEEPNVDQTIVTPEPETPTSVDIEGLMEQLESAQVTDPEKLKGKLANANAFAKAQSERDQYANELNALRQEVQGLKNPKREDYENYDMDAQPVDLEGTILKVLDKRDQVKAQNAQRAQQAYLHAYNKITKNPNYKLVKKEFEEKIGDPMTQFAISNGQINPVEMFNDMLVGHFQGLASQAVQAFKQLKGTEGVKAPHVESGARVSADSVKVPTDKDKKIEQIRKRGSKGKPLHEDEMDFMLEDQLGDLFKE